MSFTAEPPVGKEVYCTCRTGAGMSGMHTLEFWRACKWHGTVNWVVALVAKHNVDAAVCNARVVCRAGGT